MAGGEVDIKPCDERVNEIIATAVENKGGREREVCSRTSVKVEGQDAGGVSNDGFDLNGIDKGFG